MRSSGELEIVTFGSFSQGVKGLNNDDDDDDDDDDDL
jgi:hypothetical protein